MTIFRRTALELSRSALAHNFKQLHKVSREPVCPMVKADAYGMGASEATRVLRQAGALAVGVALVEEVEALRRSGDQGPIWFFGSITHLETALGLLDAKGIPVVGSIPSLEFWLDALVHEHAKAAKVPESIPQMVLDFNTGMNRLGLDRGEIPDLVKTLLEASQKLGVEPRRLVHSGMTHFIDGSDWDQSQRQVRDWQACLTDFTAHAGFSLEFQHASNSAHLSRVAEQAPAEKKAYGSRPGIALYGTGENVDQARLDLKPVIRWRSELAQLRRVSSGETVSYGGNWKATRPSLIGVVACGYADGYRRGMRGAQVLIHGHRAPVVGTICMDYFMVDLTDVAPRVERPLQTADPVVLLGPDLTTEATITAVEMASWCNTISYEILTGVSTRVPRIWAEDFA